MNNYYQDIPKWTHFTFDVSHEDVIFDIENITHKYGQAKYNGENARNISILQIDDSNQNTEIIGRLLARQLATLHQKMMRYVESVKTGTIEENGHKQTITTFYMTFPPNCNTDKIGLVKEVVHDYLVNSCIAGYLRIVNPKDTTIYEQNAEIAISRIKYILNARIPGTQRIPYKFQG